MRFYGVYGDAQTLGNIPVRQAVGQKQSDISLAWREQFETLANQVNDRHQTPMTKNIAPLTTWLMVEYDKAIYDGKSVEKQKNSAAVVMLFSKADFSEGNP